MTRNWIRRRLNRIAKHRLAVLILALYLVLGALYSVIDPVFEASDEWHHYPFVAHLAQGGNLPVQRAGVKTLWEQEGIQPPLYYALAAGLTAPIDTSDLPDLMYINPHAQIGVPLYPDNKNLIVHTEREAFPWHGTTLAVHLIRFFSLLLGAGTVLCTYLTALMLFPARPPIAIAAMALNAFLPMFLFIAASVDNDNLVIVLASLGLLLLVRLVLQGSTRPRLLLLGVVLGLACLSKLSALALLPVAAAAFLYNRIAEPLEMAQEAGKRRAGRVLKGWLVDCLSVFLPVLLIAGWWYLRNWHLYGDPTGMSVMLDFVGRRPAIPGVGQLLGEFQGFRISYWGLFGGVNVLMQPDWIYRVLDGLTLLAVVGLAAWAWQKRRAHPSRRLFALVLLAAWLILEMLALLRYTLFTLASTGRLILPALSAICLFLAIGLLRWFPLRRQPAAAWGLAGLFFILAVSVPFTSIRPAYARSDLIVPEVPASAQRIDFQYGDKVRLLAFDIPGQHVRPGEVVPVTLYWQALAPIDEDYSVFVHFWSVEGIHPLAQSDSYTGGGTYPTRLWTPGQIVRDTVQVKIPDTTLGPRPLWLRAGMYTFETMQNLRVTNSQGQEVAPTLAKIALDVPSPTLKPAHDLSVKLGDGIVLMGYDLADDAQVQAGSGLELRLYWQALGEINNDYKVFVHIVDQNDATVGQADALPSGGAYPTSAWSIGEIIEDTHQFTVPGTLKPGTYRILVGLYDPVTGRRVAVPDGQNQPGGDRILVTALRVGSR